MRILNINTGQLPDTEDLFVGILWDDQKEQIVAIGEAKPEVILREIMNMVNTRLEELDKPKNKIVRLDGR